MPSPAHGVTTESPSPTPNASSTNVNAQETMAPAITAAHETPATDGSPVSAPGWMTTVSIIGALPCHLVAKLCSSVAVTSRETYGSTIGNAIYVYSAHDAHEGYRTNLARIMPGPQGLRLTQLRMRKSAFPLSPLPSRHGGLLKSQKAGWLAGELKLQNSRNGS